MSRSAETQAETLAKTTITSHTRALPEATDPTKATTFEQLGLHPPIVASLKAAFSNVKNPTETQAEFIPAILSGKDVLLKDETGSGKSFGLVVALLNKPRVSSPGKSKNSVIRHVTSLVLVPHRDLAYQLLHWIERMTSVTTPPPLLATIGQVLVRDGRSHLTDGLRLLRQTPPHILIGTPQAIMDVYNEDPEALQLEHLSSVVVDEVDYLVETVPNKDPSRSYYKATLKAKKKLLAHPGVTRQLLELGGTGISHSVLLVSENGIKNIAGAKAPSINPAETDHLHAIDPQTLFAPTAESKAVETDPDIAESEYPCSSGQRLIINVLLCEKEYKGTPTPFNPNVIEAIATAFALDVPSVALLVLPSSSPVQRAVYELREMGVNAHGLDLLTGEKGRSHLLRGDGNGQDNPTLLVSTLATTRGLDLPELTHVFIMGIPDGPKVNGRTIDGYVHLAGRVGRFGRGGKVVTVVEQEGDVEEGEEGTGGVSQGSKMLRILATINKTPTAFVHFD
ncbi:hypothetical protein C0992_012078 [Termitomyces sp. T32_za158]|nr:hypothetical protein C0992_012078 [Termitomyces sp. T32_za158]